MKRFPILLTPILLMFFWSGANSYAQVPAIEEATQMVDVPPIPQKASMLCWAASIQMIAKFHGVTKSQCTLSNYLTGSTLGAGEQCVACNANRFFENPFNLTINNGVSGQMDLIFSKAGFYSIEDATALPWKLVKRQLDNCRPFILACDMKKDVVGNDGLHTQRIVNHAMVAKGYFDQHGRRYIYVNDPWREPCGIDVYAVNYDEMYDEGNWIFVTYAVHNIYKKSRTECCEKCKPNQVVSFAQRTGANDFLDKASANAHKMVAPMKLAIPDNLLKTKLNTVPNNYSVELHLISMNKLDSATVPLLTIKLVRENKFLYDIIYSKFTTNIVTTIQKKGQVWKDIVISNQTYPSLLSARIGNTTENVKLSYKNLPQHIRYEYVKCPGLFREFYRFRHNNVDYLLPKQAYPDSDPANNLDAGIAVPEAKVLAILQKLTRKYYHA
jgi:hypothetical protein